eukprot:3332589-Lingulodinium_polyedra.AAC.1
MHAMLHLRPETEAMELRRLLDCFWLLVIDRRLVRRPLGKDHRRDADEEQEPALGLCIALLPI